MRSEQGERKHRMDKWQQAANALLLKLAYHGRGERAKTWRDTVYHDEGVRMTENLGDRLFIAYTVIINKHSRKGNQFIRRIDLVHGNYKDPDHSTFLARGFVDPDGVCDVWHWDAEPAATAVIRRLRLERALTHPYSLGGRLVHLRPLTKAQLISFYRALCKDVLVNKLIEDEVRRKWSRWVVDRRPSAGQRLGIYELDRVIAYPAPEENEQDVRAIFHSMMVIPYWRKKIRELSGLLWVISTQAKFPDGWACREKKDGTSEIAWLDFETFACRFKRHQNEYKEFLAHGNPHPLVCICWIDDRKTCPRSVPEEIVVLSLKDMIDGKPTGSAQKNEQNDGKQ